MRIGELARLAGVSTDTLRHYERKRILAAPRRSPNGYREYPPQALSRIRLVQGALSVGFTLDELAHIFSLRDSDTPPCQEVRALAENKLAEMENRLREIESVRDELRALLQDWDKRLKETGADERARLLEAFSTDNAQTRRRLSPLAPRGVKHK